MKDYIICQGEMNQFIFALLAKEIRKLYSVFQCPGIYKCNFQKCYKNVHMYIAKH